VSGAGEVSAGDEVTVSRQQLDALREAVEWLDAYVGDDDAPSRLATMSLQAAVRTLEELGVAVERFDPDEEDEEDEEEGEA